MTEPALKSWKFEERLNSAILTLSSFQKTMRNDAGMKISLPKKYLLEKTDSLTISHAEAGGTSIFIQQSQMDVVLLTYYLLTGICHSQYSYHTKSRCRKEECNVFLLLMSSHLKVSPHKASSWNVSGCCIQMISQFPDSCSDFLSEMYPRRRNTVRLKLLRGHNREIGSN